MHLRTQIRNAIHAKLLGLVTTGANVFKTRVYVLEDEELPALIVSAEQESNEVRSAGYPRLTARSLVVSVNAYAKINDDLDDVLDQICLEVEKALANDVSLGGIAKDLLIEQTNIEMDVEGERPKGVARMFYRVTYYINELTPDVAI